VLLEERRQYGAYIRAIPRPRRLRRPGGTASPAIAREHGSDQHFLLNASAFTVLSASTLDDRAVAAIADLKHAERERLDMLDSL
jgi:hypothetical protein